MTPNLYVSPLLMRIDKRTQSLLVALLLCFFTSAFADESEGLGSDKWPETVNAATQMIISRLPEKDRLLVKNTKKEDLIQYHHGWGTGIRNYYGLWRGTINFCCRRVESLAIPMMHQ